jgi:hypothetical protein
MNMGNKIIILCLLVAILATGCGVKTVDNIVTEKPNQTQQIIAEPTQEVTQEPTDFSTAESSPELESNFVYIDEVTLAKPFDTIFLNNWNLTDNTNPFKTNDIIYTKGIGMFIDPKMIMSKEAAISAIWNLEKKYNKISFDIGCEQTMDYDVSDKFGEFKVIINADGKQVWESGFKDYSYFMENQNFSINKDCERLEIKLKQRKGAEGTLKVVLGNFKLYKN